MSVIRATVGPAWASIAIGDPNPLKHATISCYPGAGPRDGGGAITFFQKTEAGRVLQRGEIQMTRADFMALKGWIDGIVRENRRQAKATIKAISTPKTGARA